MLPKGGAHYKKIQSPIKINILLLMHDPFIYSIYPRVMEGWYFPEFTAYKARCILDMSPVLKMLQKPLKLAFITDMKNELIGEKLFFLISKLTYNKKMQTPSRIWFTLIGIFPQQHSGGSTCGLSGCMWKPGHSWDQEPGQANLK